MQQEPTNRLFTEYFYTPHSTFLFYLFVDYWLKVRSIRELCGHREGRPQGVSVYVF